MKRFSWETDSFCVMMMVIMVGGCLTAITAGHMNQQLPNDCVGHACEECVCKEDARILMVRYFTCDKGHAFCVYRHNGRTFAWDWRGAQRVDDAEALPMAQRLVPPAPGLIVSSAAFEYDSTKL
jgi:hypothetical protein